MGGVGEALAEVVLVVMERAEQAAESLEDRIREDNADCTCFAVKVCQIHKVEHSW